MNELMLLLFSHIDSTDAVIKLWRICQAWQVRHLLICSWYDGILTSVWSLRKAETQHVSNEISKAEFWKNIYRPLIRGMSEHFFSYCFLWFMTSEPFIFKSSLTAIRIWFCENWIKMTVNMVEHPHLDFFYTHVLHNSIRRLYTSWCVVVTLWVIWWQWLFFFLTYGLSQHELFCASLFWLVLNSPW